MAKKLYLLDTNVLLYDPKAFDTFEGVTIGIPGVVLEELDTFKREGTDRGRNARQVIRTLDELRDKGSLQDGVKLKNGSTVKVVFAPNKAPVIPFRLPIDDNEILLTAYALTKQYDVKFISKDINARVKADALGLTTEDYIHETISEEEFYRGWVRVSVPSIQLKQDIPKLLEEYAHDEHDFAPNEFALVESNNNPQNYRLFRYGTNKKFMPVQEPRLKWPLHARNPQQVMALNLLLDPAVKLVNLFGTAGTGKTFLALLAGLHQVLIEERYEKMLVARPVVPLGRDIGYLPGTMQEKLYSWMLPVYDNMEFIMHAAGGASAIKSTIDRDREQESKFNKKHKHKKHNKDKHGNFHEGRILTLDDMMRWGKISLEAITYMRGRSIPYQYILIDEAQNLTPHEVKTLVSRVGEDSKIILAGDPYQIDTPYLDFSSNGLVVTGEKMKGQPLFGSVFLEHSERSELSQLAAELL